MRTDRLRSTAAATAIVVGGVVAAVTFLPFTLAHGPTSYNLGLWRLRGLVAGERRVTVGALGVRCAAMVLFAAMNGVLGAIALGVIPPETSDRFDGARLFGLIAFVGVGALWATFGAVLMPGGQPRDST